MAVIGKKMKNKNKNDSIIYIFRSQIQELGQQTLNDFNACMFCQTDSILSDELTFKLISISTMLVDRIQRTRSRTIKRMSIFFYF